MPPFSFAEDVPDVEYIVDLGPNDVLSGRGGATNSFKGNRAFRVLVKEYQKKYLQAKKRDKPAVAAIVVDIIRQKGGRFLQRCNSAKTPRPGLNHFHTPNSLNGEILWLDIGDDRAREKTCQALREGAPEIRRKTSVPKGKKSAIDNGSASSSFDDDEDVDDVEAEDDATQHRGSRSHPVSSSTEAKDTDATLSSPSTMEGTPKGRKSGDRYTPLVPGAPRLSILEEDSEDGWEGKRRRKDFDALTLHNHSYEHKDEDDRNDDEEESPIFIRPWSRLIPDRLSVPTIALDQLSVQDRDMYLRDFLPPCPRTERHQSRRQHESTMELSFANAVVIPGISSSVDNSFFEKTNSLGPFEDVQHVNCSSGSGTGINKPTKKEPALQAT